MGLREDSCQQLLTVWRKNGLYAVKLCGHFFCVMARMAQRALGAGVFPEAARCAFSGLPNRKAL
ncbi:hypothetical protein P831_03855 [Klebsiella aerogenes UCI 28]|nr:hypothetical protein P831_03855 [Klebsiella aerogenes UCI 28]EUL85626.1 hypothetical protein P830_01829 [Klebsiella aerogenes UCI 27]MCP1410650.1 hypothetical protein [Klebsiella aerogenes]VAE45295.1 Uncharacterised protein [Klebsiella aerogenes]